MVMSKVAVTAIVVIIILLGLSLIAVPFEGNPLYQTLTHIELAYSAEPQYASPLSDCNYTVSVRAYKDYKSRLFAVDTETPQIRNRERAMNRLQEFMSKYVNKFNFTLYLNITILDNSTGQLLYQKILNIYDVNDKEIHIYRDVTELQPCTYVKIIVQLHLEISYVHITGETYQLTKDLTKERVIHIETSPTVATEYQLYSKQ
jgi:hypothetical protein